MVEVWQAELHCTGLPNSSAVNANSSAPTNNRETHQQAISCFKRKTTKKHTPFLLQNSPVRTMPKHVAHSTEVSTAALSSMALACTDAANQGPKEHKHLACHLDHLWGGTTQVCCRCLPAASAVLSCCCG
jgi:hypothetical protein